MDQENNNLNNPSAPPDPQDQPKRAAYSPTPLEIPENNGKVKGGKGWLIGLGVALAVAIAAIVLVVVKMNDKIDGMDNANKELQNQNEQLMLTNEQIQLSNEYRQLEQEYAQYEGRQELLQNDSIVEKYAAAKARVEKLLKELNDQKTKSAAEIKKLQDEIATLKDILRHYVEQIDALGKENEALRVENTEIKNENSQLKADKAAMTQKNKVLSDRMELAEKLNVTGVNLVGLKDNNKTEKNITKAKKLEVTFTIPQNNSTPVGEKTIYLRIISPEGTLLGNRGTFEFEGASIPFTARTTIEYAGEEIGGIKIYYDREAALTPGDYTVELFTAGYRLYNGRFTMKK